MIYSDNIAYGAEITAPDAPEKEGHSFTGWGVVPATMPAYDVELSGGYDINYYGVIFKIGDEVISSSQVVYGGAITIPEAPSKEGYSFVGWGEVPAAMPAENLEFNGSYDVNSYALTFKIGDDVIYSEKIAYGADIVTPQAPEGEGFTFSGWSDVPAVMPAHDLEFDSKYTANEYELTYMIGDEIIKTVNVAYGEALVAPEAPEKEGYSFDGWIDMPESMPNHNLVIYGSYSVNYYRLLVYVNDEVYIDEEIAYGDEVVVPDPEVETGMKFEGWQEEIPAVMPAHDVEIHGTVVEDELSAVNAVLAGDNITVLTLDGVVIYKNVKASDIKERLTPGIYIINGKKMVIR